ncbi:P-loop containing nucleoside triphosphate hydrolase protein [Neoconidiobolus thromboides FSU 785]|nr:P-loop containing nucleoside triphosphate hydrolase protein [Neoconidiobolus thromboides FSU 785]
MPAITPTQISKLHKNTNNIRNICILAHVDHGKTTLSDSLLASNGIISSKLAGKVRYLDSREDEQLRGITMESSAISLQFEIQNLVASGEIKSEQYLINLIDSPGHVDFSSEVSSASRLCDGALVLVDAVEGVCTQTQMVLYQAWKEKIQPILVLNKIDRLITELQLTSTEAYTHLNKILEQVNALMSGLFTDELIQKDSRIHEAQKAKDDQNTQENEEDLSKKIYDWNLEDSDDSHIYFSPEKGNVLFSSATDGWAFRVNTFAKLYAQKMGLKEAALQKYLWGDFYFDAKNKKVLLPKHLKGKAMKPMFVQFVLDNIWAVYDSVITKSDPEKVQKIIKTLNLKILPRDLKSKDPRVLLTSIFTQWLPISRSILLTIIDKIPSPLVSQVARLPALWHPDEEEIPEATTELEKAIYNCDISEEAPVVAYVSKTFFAPIDALSVNRRVQLSAEEMRQLNTRAKVLNSAEGPVADIILQDGSEPQEPEDKVIEIQKEEEDTSQEVLVGFARLFSGTIKLGQKLYVLGPKYNPENPDQHCSEIIVESLYLIMGRELTNIQEVPAGNVFGIGGIEGHIFKSGMLSTTKECHNLGALRKIAAPILRVALEPWNLSDMPKLVEGLKLLNISDPCVEIYLQETGEHILATAGELHLERCLTDLKERFSKVEIQVSPPIVPFRETIVVPAETNFNTCYNQSLITFESPAKNFSLGIRLVPLPKKVYEYLIEYQDTIHALIRKGSKKNKENITGLGETQEEEAFAQAHSKISLETFLNELEKKFSTSKNTAFWEGIVEKIWTFGPKRIGPNILVNNLDYDHPSFRESITKGKVSTNPKWLESTGVSIREIEEGLVTGFQSFTATGPLCNEPIIGTCCFIESFDLLDESNNNNSEDQENSITPNISSFGAVGGQLITAMKESCKTSFMGWSPRLMLATYSCDIQATADVLGRVYGVINKRRGRILSEEMKEGTSFFQIASKIPVIESFNFADEIRKRTSGAAIPLLIFTGFEVLDQDPFWVPSTEEELEDLGEKADRENLAKKYMEGVRKRKGLFVEKKVVESAEKQRTLKK